MAAAPLAPVVVTAPFVPVGHVTIPGTNITLPAAVSPAAPGGVVGSFGAVVGGSGTEPVFKKARTDGDSSAE
eukprot:190-Heterococcus_DN1.PRE.1